MSADLRTVAADVGVDVAEVLVWVERRWVQPARCGEELAFDDADLARLRMLVEFRRDLLIDDEVMPVVLGLVDRLHATRVRLRQVLEVISGLPGPVRADFVEKITKGEDT